MTVQHCWANDGSNRDSPVLIEEAWCYFGKDRILLCTAVFGFLIDSSSFFLFFSFFWSLYVIAERRLIRMKTVCLFDRRDGKKGWGGWGEDKYVERGQMEGGGERGGERGGRERTERGRERQRERREKKLFHCA